MGSWHRRNQVNSKNDEEVSKWSDPEFGKYSERLQEYKDLLVFGYTSTIFPNDYTAEHIAEERHMVPCLGDVENRVDR